jgi:hypothetical protein
MSKETLKAGQGHLGALVLKALHWRQHCVGGDAENATVTLRARCSDLKQKSESGERIKHRKQQCVTSLYVDGETA